jgi:hypothetical protein
LALAALVKASFLFTCAKVKVEMIMIHDKNLVFLGTNQEGFRIGALRFSRDPAEAEAEGAYRGQAVPLFSNQPSSALIK